MRSICLLSIASLRVTLYMQDMTEGEVPEIPQHLQESLPSAGAQEEAIRRDYQIREMAWRHRIPEASLSNPTVHRYVSTLRDLDAALERNLQPSAEIDTPVPSLNEEVVRARGIYSLAQLLLTDGVGRGYLDEAELGHTVDQLVQRFAGKRAVWEHSRPHREPTPPSLGLWFGNVTEDDYPLTGRESCTERYDGWWVRPDATTERDDPEHRAALAEEARRQGWPDDEFHGDALARSMITEDERRRDIEKRSLFSNVVYARQLASATTDLDALPPAPGMTPSAVDRLARVAPLMKLAVRTLEEPFHPGGLDPREVTDELAKITQPLGLKIS